MSDGRTDGWGTGETPLPPPPPPSSGAGGPGLPPPPGRSGWGDDAAQGMQGMGQGFGPVPAQRNGLALASLICGLTSLGCLILFFLLITVPLAVVLGIAAIVTGILGLRAVKRDGKGGRGQAIGGIVTGTLSILAVGLIAVLAITAWSTFDFQTNPFADPEGFVEELEERGFEVDEEGQLDLEELERRLQEDLEDDGQR